MTPNELNEKRKGVVTIPKTFDKKRDVLEEAIAYEHHDPLNASWYMFTNVRGLS